MESLQSAVRLISRLDTSCLREHLAKHEVVTLLLACINTVMYARFVMYARVKLP